MIYRFEDYELDTERFELRRDEEALHVEPQTFDFILFLIKHHDRVVTREEIIDHVWQGRIVSDTTISSCVKSARKILGDDGDQQNYIKTTRGRGFQFVATLNFNPVEEGGNKHKISDTKNLKQLTVYLIIAMLIIIIGLMLYNRYQASQFEQNPENGNIVATGENDYSIAVMPFVDLSAEGNQEYFGDGISEEILSVLTSIPELDVTSRTTSFSLKGQNLSVPEISERLNVNYIVEGSVRRSANRIRITAQLIDTRIDSHLWSENYDRELDDIFTIQDDISQQVAAALKVELMGGSIGGEAPTQNMDAYALYLQGHQLFLNRGTLGVANNIANIERAIALLQQAVELDENFANAWADLATSYIIMPSYYDKRFSADVVAPNAIIAADKAIAIDPGLSQAWAVKSLVYLSQFEFELSEEAILRATSLNPNNETAWLWQGLHFAAVGNQGRAIEALENAIDIAPNVPINHSALGMFYHAKGDLEQAVSFMDKAIDELGFEAGRIDRALLAMWNGNRSLASEHMVKFFQSYNQADIENLDRKIDLYTNVYSNVQNKADVINYLKQDLENGIDTTYGIYMLLDAETFVYDFENNFANRGFILSRIYNPIARPLFQQKPFRDYLIKIGLLNYWKENQFPYFCRPLGEADFQCEIP